MTPVRQSARTTRVRRRRRTLAAFAVALAVAGTWVGIWLATSQSAQRPDGCQVGIGRGRVGLDLAQAQNASIIAAVALHKGLADHAVTVALAAALQESKLYNIPYGDLDSVGLFQQRPSQGWGTNSQLLNPIYATSAFYDRLVHVSGWQTLPVTEAAQRVQRSAAPDAYGYWESEARTLASALTGETRAAFTCHVTRFAGALPARSALASAADQELGPNLLQAPLAGKTGWRVAAWVVAHAWAYHLAAVAFDGQEWTARSGAWRVGGPLTKTSAPNRVTIVSKPV